MNEVTIKRKTGIALFGSNGVEINLKTLRLLLLGIPIWKAIILDVATACFILFLPSRFIVEL